MHLNADPPSQKLDFYMKNMLYVGGQMSLILVPDPGDWGLYCTSLISDKEMDMVELSRFVCRWGLLGGRVKLVFLFAIFFCKVGGRKEKVFLQRSGEIKLNYRMIYVHIDRLRSNINGFGSSNLALLQYDSNQRRIVFCWRLEGK